MNSNFEKYNNERIQKVKQLYENTKSQPQDIGQIRTLKIDLYDLGNSYLLRISLPGVKKEDLRLSFAGDLELEIKGIVKGEINRDYKEVIFNEIYRGPFYRKVVFPHKIRKGNMSFDYVGGLLEIMIEKEI